MSHSHFAHAKETMRMRKFSHIRSHIFSHDKQCECEESSCLSRARAQERDYYATSYFFRISHIPIGKRETRISQTNCSETKSVLESRRKYLTMLTNPAADSNISIRLCDEWR